ncbi:MAG: T9SS type A sorting domain-containing protein [Firmicutes bacterium]|nr:T9SS type A sorting domain-containing protein [Bacillota bacterium]MCM1400761.1 T9SS type A sorting domain-containing protein [Bacteroides sp.]MCM1477608.1 T9SS type A sorting domain-containing protein [Bacteroides sp.]
MKKIILIAMALLAMVGNSYAAQKPAAEQLKKVALTSHTSSKQAIKASSSALTMSNVVTAICDQRLNPVSYYVVLSDNNDATFDSKTGAVNINTGYVLCLDLYSIATSPVSLPAGLYSPQGLDAGTGNYTYDSEYTYLIYYQNGKEVSSALLDGAITITTDGDGVYEISCNITANGASREIKYKGRIPFTTVGEVESVYPQIKHDIEVDMIGGIAFYQGITDYSNNGVTYIDLFSTEYDENGVLLKDGFALNMMVAHKRVITKDKFQLFPGTYTNAYSLDRFTWYPCREINYSFGGSVITTQFGSYIRELKSNTSDRYTYGYLASGEFVFEEVGDGIYKGHLDAVTNLGFKVKVNFQGPITLNTDNAQVGSSPLSWLEDDVQLDFSKLDKGRVFHRNIMGGCRDLTVDLGSPSGRDEAINYGGDLLRLEFLCPQTDVTLQPGVYTVVPRRWNDNELAAGGKYEPMSLNQYRWGNNGDMDGTRYCHFENDRYCVYDLWGPVMEGQVKVETTDHINYYMDIDLVDDAGFKITGIWDGPLELQYNPDDIDLSGIVGAVETIADENLQVVVEPGAILVLNAGNAPVELYNITGVLVARGTADKTLSTEALASGIYILKVNNRSIKVAF